MIIDDMKNSTMNGEAEKADFCEENSKRWCFVSDKVMGGVSEGTFETVIEGEDAHYNMQGNVSTENNGGFLQFRTKINNHPDGKLYKGIRIQVRGNNEEYALHIRTKYLFLHLIKKQIIHLSYLISKIYMFVYIHIHKSIYKYIYTNLYTNI